MSDIFKILIMEDLLLNPNFQLNKPIIYFKVNGELTIMGRSINENIVEYYHRP